MSSLFPSVTPSPRREPAQNPHGQWIGGQVLAILAAAGTTAHRLFSSGDAWVERYGEDVLISYKTAMARDQLMADFPQWAADREIEYRRLFGKFLPRHNAERAAPVLLAGETAAPLKTVVEENGMKFAIDFSAGYSAGLFIDQRANRAFVRRAGARRLLNTFAYTCSFSVAAALVDAETVSIDLSKTSLNRGRENFTLNELEASAANGHRFYADDVLDVLPRLARKGEQFDAIILDPPTFSRGNKGREFQVERNFETLLSAALELAAPKARLLLSTNCTRLTRRALEAIARFCLKTARRGGTFHSEPELPDVPAPFAPQTLWVTLTG